ncbi:prenyltransferase/squalene oxidase repeat-containing protein [Botrimarina sp.]|uniref:prenyltransferase/squalene oxidase repeat-containing protein n=1 Tax=Botrimarina sp. TaxID=2795802 RepID=UPI0032EDAB06
MRGTLALPLAVALAATPVSGQASTGAPEVSELVSDAVGYLKTSQTDEGAFSPQLGPAITGLVATGLLRHGRSMSDPLVSDAVDYVLGFVQPDGGVYSPGSTHRNYETCIAVQMLREAAEAPGAKSDYKEVLAGADAFLRGLQWDAEEGHDISSLNYGGAGYGGHSRPDLSNTSFLIDALHSLGAGPDDPAIQKALVFVSRTQNLESEHNATPFAAKVNDGGFYYTPAAGGTSQAGETAGGGLRSYGSMTYAGLKSMIYAGVGPDDPRVEAAYNWIRRHYTLNENPGMGSSGLYYYYHTFAKALDAIGEPVITEADGSRHDWRAELVRTLADAQQESGAWVNSNERWLESDPNLSTAYALLALSYCDEAEPARAQSQR